MGGGSRDSPTKRREGLGLLRKVYDELYSQLGEEFSTVELLKAAQVLIDATKEEYGVDVYQDGQLHPGYYSFDVFRMITDEQWWIVRVESTPVDIWEDGNDQSNHNKNSIKRYYNPDQYYHRG